MKKWLYLIGALATVAVLSRLPHPARDIAKLEPVRAAYLYIDQGQVAIETDTGSSGSGPNLKDAYAALKRSADREIFLDTAEFLILDPNVPIPQEIYEIFRPDCKVVLSNIRPDLEEAPDYLSQHKPQLTLARLRASLIQR